MIRNRNQIFSSHVHRLNNLHDEEQRQKLIEEVVNQRIQRKECEILLICDCNLNQPSGHNIIHEILALFNDLDELNDIVGLISKLTLRYMF